MGSTYQNTLSRWHNLAIIFEGTALYDSYAEYLKIAVHNS